MDLEKRMEELADKIGYICRELGKKVPDSPIEVYEYKGDNLNFFYINGKGDVSDISVETYIVKNLEGEYFFSYDVSNSPEGEGVTDIYQSGNWEKLVEDHYQFALDN
jgi:hypothetical protein